MIGLEKAKLKCRSQPRDMVEGKRGEWDDCVRARQMQ